MKKEKNLLFRFMKRADKQLNRIIIPKFIIDNYGRDFYMNVYDDGSIELIPITKLNKEKGE